MTPLPPLEFWSPADREAHARRSRRVALYRVCVVAALVMSVDGIGREAW